MAPQTKLPALNLSRNPAAHANVKQLNFRLVILIMLSPFYLLACTATPPESSFSGSAGPGDPLQGTGAVDRVHLTSESFDQTETPELVPNTEFALPANAAPALHHLQGRVVISPLADQTKVQILENPEAEERTELRAIRLPEMNTEWVQHESHLIPVRRGLIYSGDPYWNYIIGPGRAWSEDGDDGWSRASAPFTLVQRNHNCVHNGVMSFLFNDQAVSAVRYQISQETCRYRKFNLWGTAGADYEPAFISDADEVRRLYALEVSQRLPVRSIETIASAKTEVSIDVPALLPEIDLEHLTVHGVEKDGIHYRGEVRTRMGAYPFPESIVIPSYSTAKIAFAAVALMRLAQRDGLEIIHTRVADLVPEVAEKGPDWADVTLMHLLDMSTGLYRDSALFVDERDSYTWDHFFWQEAHEAKLEASLSYPRRSSAGQDFVYHTSDTFLLIRALQNYLQTRDGADADIYRFVRDEVFVPLGLSQGVFEVLRTDNSPDGLPFGGYGMFWVPDDIVKMAAFLNRDGGPIGSRQILHPDMLASAMQRNANDRGLPVAPGRKYKAGLWAYSVDPDTWISQMLGYGGIIVDMLPGGATYYYVSDGGEFYNDEGQFASTRAVMELQQL